MHQRSHCVALALLLVLAPIRVQAIQITANYDPFEADCDVTWVEANCWDSAVGDVVPNNGADTYIATILQTPSPGLLPVNLTLDGLETAATVTLDMEDGSTFSIVGDSGGGTTGSFVNNGTFNFNGVGVTDWLVNGGTVTVSGAGRVHFSDSAFNRVRSTDNSSTLANDTGHTIEGAVKLGNNSLAIENYGLIVANAAVNKLIVDPGLGQATNTGTMKSSAGGTLRLDSGIFTNAGGTIAADDGSLTELSDVTIIGGTLETSGSGVIRNVSSAILDGVGMVINGAFEGANGTTTTLRGDITNQGTLSLVSTGSNTEYVVNGGTVTLDGGGSMQLSDNSLNRIRSNDNSTLVNVDNTIEGAGRVGVSPMSITNQGTIRANSTNSLRVDPGGGSVVNSGVMEATGGARLIVGGGSIDNFEGPTNGLIRSDASVVEFDGATVTGGNVQVQGAGTIELDESTLTDGTLSNSATGRVTTTAGNNQLGGTFNNPLGGEMHVGNGSTLFLEAGGTYSNQGGWFMDATGNSTDFGVVGGTATLSGGGTFTWSDSAQNRMRSTDSSIFENLDNTIQGAGSFGKNSIGIINSGTIVANAAINKLVVDPGLGQATNTGTMKSSAGGTLRLDSGIFTNAGGTIAADAGSLTELSDVTIIGGTLKTSGSGVIRNVSSAILDGVGMVINGAFEGANGTTTTLRGDLTNQGTLSLLSTGNSTDYVINGGTVTLDGGGSMQLSDNSSNRIRSNDNSILVNVDNTISGAGNISVALQNSGTLSATGASALHLTTTDKINDGLFHAEAGGTLSVSRDVRGTGSWRADGGTIQLNSGVDVTTSGNVDVLNGGLLQLDNANMTTFNLLVDSLSAIDVGSTLVVEGDFIFALTEESDWTFDANSVVEMAGGVGASIGDWSNWGSLEVGGADSGLDPLTHLGDPAGFESNFDLPTLEIGPGARVFLTDVIDNGNRNGTFGFAEALYVDTLVFSDSIGLLNLNGLNLYYNTLVGNESQIINARVPEPAGLPMLLAAIAMLSLCRQRAG